MTSETIRSPFHPPRVETQFAVFKRGMDIAARVNAQFEIISYCKYPTKIIKIATDDSASVGKKTKDRIDQLC